MRLKRLLLTLLVVFAPTFALAQDATINFSDLKQQIDGFGTADSPTALTSALADQFFTTQAGIGLSIFRMKTEAGGSGPYNSDYTALWSDAKLAGDRGAKLWMAPGTAATGQKDNGSLVNGHLLAGSYTAWATTLAGFQADLLTNSGHTLYAQSVQNEPDFTPTYESMEFTTAEMTAFIKVLGPLLHALTPPVKLMGPEAENWSTAASYMSDTNADATAKAQLDIPAVHQYEGTVTPLVTVQHVWQTEMSAFDAFDASITSGLTLAGWVHSALTTGNVNAWISWWDMGQNGDNEGLIGSTNGDTTITKRFWTFGNYSKFIRPGSFRVGVTGGPSGVSVSAFKSGGADQVEIVAINTSGSSASLVCDLSGLIPATVTPWVTSSTQNLAALAPITVTAGSFTATIANNTVTTFVGTIAAPARFRKLRIR